MPSTCYIALGSNLGNRGENLHRALAAIAQLATTRVVRISQFITTTPVGGPAGQENYLNAAAQLTTELSPEDLLKSLLAIERDIGRDRARAIRNGPRNIDLDILLYDNLLMDNPELKIPHPHMHERLFVLRPLAEIAATVIHPRLEKTVMALLRTCPMGSCDSAQS
ncbi:MAG: 2-amino-4-hydroxy-6-hydroxymethyldihydropteridine diphosphokinase [Planctomycetia bacterium]|jgi:2-amino-4-hydroxy-6-hydroxymethyldihydropteridine diphosphokinase|nr:2-amino-4-hydroxy-6-hydroxymethyldihydropteridine diphosphokinase [Planctomycetia bacterium]